MAEPYPIRPISPDEFDAFYRVDEQAFHGRPMSKQRRAHLIEQFEFDRSLVAFDGDQPVGISGIYSLQVCVPGGMAPAAGITFIAVLPSHRRRGILSSLMRRELAHISERGEAIALLWASESGIYRRYGYGPASWQVSITVHHGEGSLTRQAAAAARRDGLRLRIADPEQVRAELGKVYEAVLVTRPGMFARDERWWDRALGTVDAGQPDSDPVRCLIAEDDSGPRGYTLYTGRQRWADDTFLPDSTLDVRELMADDPDATAALWADLLSRDLTSEFTARLRPADDPLWHLLADGRRSRPRLGDGLWARLVDVPRALAQRRYACPVDVVIDVTDDYCPHNQGRWRLTVSGEPASDGTPGLAATCGPATHGAQRALKAGPADLSLDVAALGAAYLGGTKLGSLVAAGLVTEHRRGAVAALSAAMSWDPSPWCPVIF